MDGIVKAQWIAALKSGDYSQATGALATKEHDGTSYCCLGVLCELAVKAGVTTRNESEDRLLGYGEDDRYSCLPQEVVEWAGLDDNNPVFSDNTGKPTWLAGLNDDGMPFEQIADVIANHL